MPVTTLLSLCTDRKKRERERERGGGGGAKNTPPCVDRFRRKS